LSAPNRNVFVNCPFDADFSLCFEALPFVVTASGYKVRCALEDDDAANIRFDKLRRLIRECPRTIHDLSRTELGANDLPRFNMPFELGLAMGAKHFGNARQRRNTALIMVRERYALPAYLSDLSGNDRAARRRCGVFRSVSRCLHHAERAIVARTTALHRWFTSYEGLASRQIGRGPDEIDPIVDPSRLPWRFGRVPQSRRARAIGPSR
jgi:hypothetical protein